MTLVSETFKFDRFQHCVRYLHEFQSQNKHPPNKTTPNIPKKQKKHSSTQLKLVLFRTLSFDNVNNFIESGEKEQLKELLRERLIECGWKYEMKSLCRSFTRKKGRNNVTVDDLVHHITPRSRSAVPDSVKAELLQRIRSFLQTTAL